MTKETVLVDKLKAESKEDFMKFRVFLELGANRSIDQAYKMYYETEYAVPSRWQTIADKYRWLDRAVEYDKTMQLVKKPATSR